MLHSSDFGPYEGRAPANLMVVGQEIVMEVTRYDAERQRMGLALRELPAR